MAGSEPGKGGITSRETGRSATPAHSRSDNAQKPTRSGTISKTYPTKGSNSPTGTKTGKGDPGGVMVSSEKIANVNEQGTGRRRVVQELGASVDNSR